MKTANRNSLTFQKPHRSLTYRLLNRGGTTLDKLGLNPVVLEEEVLLKIASQRTGLDDFGDLSFRTPLRILLDALKEEARLNFVGKVLFKEMLLGSLSNRLNIQQDLKNYPEIKQVSIKKPLFIVGLPRSGTTFLFNLLSQDPQSRWLHNWEVTSPSPPPEAEKAIRDPRIKEARKRSNLFKSLAPNLDSIHYSESEWPEECQPLFWNNFTSISFFCLANVPSYWNWLKQEANWLSAYQYYYSQLQLLSWKWSKSHWLFKDPAHLGYLKELLTVFPDANIIQTHRDLTKVLPSTCSLSSLQRGMSSEFVDLNLVGEQFFKVLSEYVSKAVEFRQNDSSERFFELNYIDLIQNPIEIVRRIYAYFGYEFSQIMEKNLQKYIQENSQHKYGVHRYSLEQFSLDPNLIQENFKDYYDRFNILSEFKTW